eukprot:TRINITY_DN1127_c0_g1_i1.p1 TRINITY_DN1127_c0_g1~~TRINITY_DN1127_c0_g1_i1.p1  ORF type:complete len:655 (+),score=258.42 TRINITY_DN1127_c0_g1_i1:38-1966(+)
MDNNNNNNNDFDFLNNELIELEKNIYQIKVLTQIDPSSCGYHSLKNGLCIAKMLKNKENLLEQIRNPIYFWNCYKNWQQSLINYIRNQKMNDSVYWNENIILDGVLEKVYCEYLLNEHNDFKDSEIEYLMFLEAVYIENCVLELSQIEYIDNVIQNWKTKENNSILVLILSGTATHWVVAVCTKYSLSNSNQFQPNIIIADSISLGNYIHTNLFNFLRNCIIGDLSLKHVISDLALQSFIRYNYLNLLRKSNLLTKSEYYQPLIKHYLQSINSNDNNNNDNNNDKIELLPEIKQLLSSLIFEIDNFVSQTGRELIDFNNLLETLGVIHISESTRQQFYNWIGWLLEAFKRYPNNLVNSNIPLIIIAIALKSKFNQVNITHIIETIANCKIEDISNLFSKESAETRLNDQFGAWKLFICEELLRYNTEKTGIAILEFIPITINLYSNQIKTLISTQTMLTENDLEPLINLIHLETLDLRFNRISIIPEYICSNLKQLKKLVLTGNCLKEIPNYIDQLENLQQLSISSNQLNQLPQTLINLKNLITLNCFRNQIKILNFQLPNSIQIISLTRNTIDTIPVEFFQNLTNLKLLDLSYNPITILPNSINNATKLEFLDLRNTKLSITKNDQLNFSFNSSISIFRLP